MSIINIYILIINYVPNNLKELKFKIFNVHISIHIEEKEINECFEVFVVILIKYKKRLIWGFWVFKK